MIHNTPISIEKFIELENVGINPANIKLDSLTFEYDKSIYVREKVIDISDKKNPIRRLFSAENAITNPTGEFLITKEGFTLTMCTGLDVNKLCYTLDEPVIFWTWIDADFIALITDTKVYHCYKDSSKPKKIVDRLPALAGFLITDYKALKGFLLLGGIPKEEGRVVKKFQAYSMDTGLNYCFDACAATVGYVTMLEDSLPSQLLCYVEDKASHYKLHLERVGPKVYDLITMDFVLGDGVADYPINIQVIQKYDIVCVITLHCFIHLYHMETATCIYRTRITNDTIFITTPKFDETGFLAVTASGQVYSIEVKEDSLIPFINYAFNFPDLELKIAVRNNIPGAEKLLMTEFDRLFQCHEYEKAAKLAAKSMGILRTTNTIERFHLIGGDLLLAKYLDILMDENILNEDESLEFVQINAHQNDKLIKALDNDKLTCSEHLGKLIMDFNLAKRVHFRAEMPKELVDFVLKTHPRVNESYLSDFRGRLLQHALMFFGNSFDSKNILKYAHSFKKPEWLIEHFALYTITDKCEFFEHMLESNVQQNFEICLEIAKKYRRELTTEYIVGIFERLKCYKGVFHFLRSGSIAHEKAETQLKFIIAAFKLGLDEGLAKGFDEANSILMNSKWAGEDFSSLIVTCDKFKYAHGLVFYFKGVIDRLIRVYLEVNPHTLPAVVGGLLDYHKKSYSYSDICEGIKNLIMGIKEWFSTKKLVEEVEKRQELGLLQEWLESRVGNGCVEQATHDALAKIYINSNDSNTNPEMFLHDNQYYNCKVIGRYCSDRIKPDLACVAYKRFYEIMDALGVKNGLDFYARKLVQCKDKFAWHKVLARNNARSKQVVNMVVSTNMFETKNEDEIQITLQALWDNNFTTAYMELLEKIVSKHPDISDNNDYETRLIMTAIHVDDSKVMNYILMLDSYVVSKVASAAMNRGLYKEVLKLIEKFNISPYTMLGIINKSTTDWKKAEEFGKEYGQNIFTTTLCDVQSIYNFEMDTHFDNCPHFRSKNKHAGTEHAGHENLNTRICCWLKDLSGERIFHTNSDYLDLKSVLEHKASKNNVIFKCDKCLWKLFNKEKTRLRFKVDRVEGDCINQAIALNADCKSILLAKGPDDIFTFPETDILRNFGLDSILYEKLFAESFKKIEFKTMTVKYHFLFGVPMWTLPQRSKYRWHTITELRTTPNIKHEVLEVLHRLNRNHFSFKV